MHGVDGLDMDGVFFGYRSFGLTNGGCDDHCFVFGQACLELWRMVEIAQGCFELRVKDGKAFVSRYVL
jgi:hypothetical protein